MARVVFAALLLTVCLGHGLSLEKKKHHKRHHGHKHRGLKKATHAGKAAQKTSQKVALTNGTRSNTTLAAVGAVAKVANEQQIAAKMAKLEQEVAAKEAAMAGMQKGLIEVNAPIPADFDERFAQAVAQATGTDPSAVKVVQTSPMGEDVAEVKFEAPGDVVHSVESQAADPDSKLANGPLHSFLVAKEDTGYGTTYGDQGEQATPVQEKGIDVDTEMPYGELEPFGREDTAQELTEQSIRESDEMVDQLERAEVAEEKRAVFRALTRLRGAAITSFDGVARAQTGNIDEYNKVHKWRKTHPLHHLADEESDISKWAFPDNADF